MLFCNPDQNEHSLHSWSLRDNGDLHSGALITPDSVYVPVWGRLPR